MTTLDALIAKLQQKIEIHVGFPKEKQVVYPPDMRKGRHNPGGQTVAKVARANEFGTKNIPSRPFLRTALRKNQAEITKMLADYYLPKNIKNGAQYLDKVGIIIKNMVVDSIVNGNWKPNSLSTKISKLSTSQRQLIGSKRKGSQEKLSAALANVKPLIDRGIMKNSVAYVVKIS